jgi:hypothetical protein
MTGRAESAAKWLTNRSEKVTSYNAVDDDFAWLEREDQDSVGLAAVDVHEVDGAMVADLMDRHPGVEIILQMRDPFRADTSAYAEAGARRVALGSWGDVLRALSWDRPGNYEHPDIGYAFRAIRPHDNVADITRLDEKRFLISRYRGGDKIVFLTTEYEPTAAELLDGLTDLGSFDYFYCTNPNGPGPSDQVRQAAADVNVGVAYKPGELMRALGRP